MRPIDLAYLSLIRRSSSSLLAILALGCALGLSGFLINLHLSVSDSLSRHEPGIDALIGPKSSSLRLLLDGLFFTGEETNIIDYRLIQTLREEIAPQIAIPFAVYARHAGYPVIGTEDSFLDLIKRADREPTKAVSNGRWYNLHTVEPEAVLGAHIARVLNLKPGSVIQPVSSTLDRSGGPVWSKKVRVVGILRESGSPHDRAIYTPISYAWEAQLRGHEEGVIHPGKRIQGASWIALTLDPDKKESNDLLRDIVGNRSVAQLVEVNRELGVLKGLLGQGEEVTRGLILLSLFLSWSVIGFLLVERFEGTRRDLGLYRALGYSRAEIAWSLIWETLFLGVMGISLGMVLERVALWTVPWIWSPVWLQFPQWPTFPLLLLWGVTLLTVLLIPLIPIIRLYRWVAHETLAAY